MAGSLLALLVPERFLRPLKNPLQLLAPMQWGVNAAVTRAADAVRDGVRPAVPAGELDKVEQERRALEHRVATLQAYADGLRQSVEALAGWRERGLAADVRLVRARVVSHDALGFRESVEVDRGSSDGVRAGDWVVSHGLLEAAAEANRPADPKQFAVEVLLSECLLGQVLETTPFTSRVVLLSDTHRRPPTRVRVARVDGGALAGEAEDFDLHGAGGEAMTVPDVPIKLYETGKVRVGDLVVSSPREPKLPIPMVIGQVDRIVQDRDNPLLCHLHVTLRQHPDSLRQVYVLARARDESAD